jgi:hypothetical protein
MNPTVVLTGRPGGTTHLSVEALSHLPPELRLIGGLAVLCRVGVPHRATVDLDALTRDLDGFDPALQRLALSTTGGGQYVMPGQLDLDVIDVSPDSAEQLVAVLAAEGPLSPLELAVVGHTWAHDTATPVTITVVDESGAPLISGVERLVASTAGLVAMKATTVPLRASSPAWSWPACWPTPGAPTSCELPRGCSRMTCWRRCRGGSSTPGAETAPTGRSAASTPRGSTSTTWPTPSVTWPPTWPADSADDPAG